MQLEIIAHQQFSPTDIPRSMTCGEYSVTLAVIDEWDLRIEEHEYSAFVPIPPISSLRLAHFEM